MKMKEIWDGLLYEDKRDDCTIRLYDGGRVTVDYGELGKEINVLDNQTDQTGFMYNPTKLDQIERYIHLLCLSHDHGHEVHQEIDEALKMFRKEAEI
ncbi:hypothetical protein D3C74_434420 [compost metagenome]